MAFLDFVRNRQQQPAQEQAQNQKPETAKDMYARQAVQEKADARPITPAIKAQADRALATMNKASQHVDPQSKAGASESSGSPQAQLQKQNNQDKTQEALSPTDNAAAKTALQKTEKAPEQTTQRASQTIARRPPSWER
jgi:hypothetical protein